MEIKFKLMSPLAKNPEKAHESDAGFDLFCTRIEKKSNYIEYHTDVAFEIPEGFVGLAFPRSSVIKKDLMLKNGVGVIDSGYRNEIIFMFNDTKAFTITQKKELYEVGEKVGQIVFVPIPTVTLLEAEELSESPRGLGGFGSTDKKI